jgi:arylsulfatase
MRNVFYGMMTAAIACGIGCATPLAAQATDMLDRSVLPIPQPKPVTITEPDWRKAQMPPGFQLTAPKGAPNVVVVLLDDMGFGQGSPFGGPIPMPVMERIAAEGVRFNRFHTAAVCSATRAALLTGRNTHAVNSGDIADNATGFPGNTFVRPDTTAPLAEILRLNGYNTAQFGKSHETPGWEKSSSGPFDRWPTGSGFEKFYGFLGGDTNNWAPTLLDGTSPVQLKRGKDYHFTVDMTDKAIEWVNAHQSLTPDKPFFIYFAPGAAHAPHHAPKEWADKFKGQFDMGWDKLREQTFARQKKLGIIPAAAKLSPRPKEIPAWDSFSAEDKKLFARQMEVFAGFVAHTDDQIGRLVSNLEKQGILDNTLFVYIAGDNGASAEGGSTGTNNETAALNSVTSSTAQMMQYYDRWGGPETYPHYAMGWAWAGNAPLPWVKQIAGHLGGSRTGMAVRWPKGIAAKGEIRSQFAHVTDIAPTVLAAAGIPEPKIVNGIPQRPMDGVPLEAAFKDARAPELHKTQYFAVFGNRGIYHDGWLASTLHNVPWLQNQKLPLYTEDKWELYDLRSDFSQAVDIAAQNPQKLKEMLAIFDQEAIRNHVYPIDDRKAERIVADIGRPSLLNGRKEMTFYPGMTAMQELAIINVKNVPFTVTADVELKDDKTQGVIFAQGGRFAGWSLYMKDGRLAYEHNFFGLERYKMASAQAVAAGKHVVQLSFMPDDPKKLGSGGKATLSVDGQQVAELHTPKMVYGAFSFDEGADVGRDDSTPVSLDYKEEDNAFTGTIGKVTISTK